MWSSWTTSAATRARPYAAPSARPAPTSCSCRPRPSPGQALQPGPQPHRAGLATAGLLDGYRATSHWACYDILRAFGIEVSTDRVVADRNRFTGGGVTAGLDFGLTILAELRGEMVARTTQFVMEYDPAPPFDSGSPAAAGPELTGAVTAMMGDLTERGLASPGP